MNKQLNTSTPKWKELFALNLRKQAKTMLSRKFNREEDPKERTRLKEEWFNRGYTGRIGGRNAKY